jgi:hypothetical protein
MEEYHEGMHEYYEWTQEYHEGTSEYHEWMEEYHEWMHEYHEGTSEYHEWMHEYHEWTDEYREGTREYHDLPVLWRKVPGVIYLLFSKLFGWNYVYMIRTKKSLSHPVVSPVYLLYCLAIPIEFC